MYYWGFVYFFVYIQNYQTMYVQNQLLDARCIWISGSRTSKQSCYDYKQAAAAAALSIILEYFYIVAIEVVAQMKLGNYVIDFN